MPRVQIVDIITDNMGDRWVRFEGSQVFKNAYQDDDDLTRAQLDARMAEQAEALQAEREWEAAQDLAQQLHDEMINDMLAQDGRWDDRRPAGRPGRTVRAFCVAATPEPMVGPSAAAHTCVPLGVHGPVGCCGRAATRQPGVLLHQCVQQDA